MAAKIEAGPDGEKKRKSSKKKRENKGNLYQYFHASLTIEIIYTVLNAITQQMRNKDKNLIKKESKNVLQQIMSSEKVKREIGEEYKKIDQRVSLVYQMDNQEFENLHKLEFSKEMLEDDDTPDYTPKRHSIDEKKGKAVSKETFAKLKLNRKVKIK